MPLGLKSGLVQTTNIASDKSYRRLSPSPSTTLSSSICYVIRSWSNDWTQNSTIVPSVQKPHRPRIPRHRDKYPDLGQQQILHYAKTLTQWALKVIRSSDSVEYMMRYGIPGSARPVVSSSMWSKAPLRCISFSMAATPLSLMLQQRHPFANSRNSSEFSAEGSSGDDTLIALASKLIQQN